jgi:hypothetical protein
MPTAEPSRVLRTFPLSTGSGRADPVGGTYEGVIQTIGAPFRTCEGEGADTRCMADFLSALGIVGFALVMLGLIWALDRV